MATKNAKALDEYRERIESVVPMELRRGKHPIVRTVGELADQLARLPRELALSDAFEVAVANCGDAAKRLGLTPQCSLEAQ
jgi:hypothetical protein